MIWLVGISIFSKALNLVPGGGTKSAVGFAFAPPRASFWQELSSSLSSEIPAVSSS